MDDKKNSTTKTLFVFVIIVAVIAGIYVLKMNMVNNLLGIGTPASTAATAPAAKSASDSALPPGAAMSSTPIETPAPAPSNPPAANTPDTPAAAPQTTPAQTAPADKKASGKKAVG